MIPNAVTPHPWSDSDRLVVDRDVLSDRRALETLVVEIQRRYATRQPTVYALDVPATQLSAMERTEDPPYELGGDFTFLEERLIKALWHNSYDATSGDLIWWWARKAETLIGAEEGGEADAILSDGTPVWIDGGPRRPLELDRPVIHHESLELRSTNFVPAPVEVTADLAPDQLEAVAHGAGPARVIAPAGSGKTRVLTERLRHLIEDRGVEPEIVTAVAYNRRAAEEMKLRLPSRIARRVRTIHSLGWAILRMAEPHLTLIDEREQRRRLEPITSAPPRANTDVIGPYLEALTEVRTGLRSPGEVEAERDDIPGFADTFSKYARVLRDRGEADHDDQIYRAIQALLADPELRRHWQGQCRHLLVDEFQDLTPGYLLLLRLVASPGLDVFGVGDDDQVIYGYSGASPRFLIDYETLFPGAGAYALETNYRCPSDVVAAASMLLGYNERRLTKEIRPRSTSNGLEVIRAPGTEIGHVAVERISGLASSGVSLDQIAVLTRVNSSLLPVQVELAERGLAFQSLLNSSVLERTLLKATLAWIRLAVGPDSMTRNDLFHAIRRPGRGLTRIFTEAVGQRRGPFDIEDIEGMGSGLNSKRRARWDAFCDDLRLVARHTANTADLLAVLAEKVGLDSAAAALDAGRSQADRSGQGDDLVALQRIAGLFPDPGGFEPWLRERLSVPSQDDGVTLSTVHRVKGLEWDHVLVFGADSSLMPHHLASDVEEERRIFHVALTRGRRSVTVLGDEGGSSPFLEELDGSRPKQAVVPEGRPPKQKILTGLSVEVGDQVGVRGGYRGVVDRMTDEGCVVKLDGGGAEIRVKWGDRIEAAGQAGPLVRGSGSVDASLLERWEQWGVGQATAQGAPAFVIFHDTTLNEIAALRPTTPEALLQVTGIGPAKLDAYGEELLDLLTTAD